MPFWLFRGFLEPFSAQIRPSKPMQVDPLSGDWLDVHQVVALLDLGLSTFKQRLRLLELYRTIQFGSSAAAGVVSEHLRRKARFHGRGDLDRLEAQLDRSFPRWRDFPPKHKLGRRFYWQASLVRAYRDRLHGIVPLP
jgi:hypothetical protein